MTLKYNIQMNREWSNPWDGPRLGNQIGAAYSPEKGVDSSFLLFVGVIQKIEKVVSMNSGVKMKIPFGFCNGIGLHPILFVHQGPMFGIRHALDFDALNTK